MGLVEGAGRAAGAPAARQLVGLHRSLDARYTSLVASVAENVEGSLSPVVAANRLAGWSVEPPHLRFRPWRDERAAFGERLARLADQARCVVFADVRECYRSIRPDAVGRALRAAGCSALESARLVSFLDTLQAIGIHGLPVGPEPSPVLANAVLSTVDRSLAASGIRNLRWVDDVVAVATGPDDAERVLAVLRAALEPAGLELNERKTRVVIDPSALRDGVGFSLAVQTTEEAAPPTARTTMPVG